MILFKTTMTFWDTLPDPTDGPFTVSVHEDHLDQSLVRIEVLDKHGQRVYGQMFEQCTRALVWQLLCRENKK